MSITVKPTRPDFVVEISGIDLAQPRGQFAVTTYTPEEFASTTRGVASTLEQAA